MITNWNYMVHLNSIKMRESVERIKFEKYEYIACCEYICLYSFTVHLIATYFIGPTGRKGSNRISIKKWFHRNFHWKYCKGIVFRRIPFVSLFIRNTPEIDLLEFDLSIEVRINIFIWFRLLFHAFFEQA